MNLPNTETEETVNQENLAKMPKKQEPGIVLPVTDVASVTFVTKKEATKETKETKETGNTTPFKLDSAFSNGKSQKDKLFALYFNFPEGLTDSQAAEHLNIDRNTVKEYRKRLAEMIAPIGDGHPQPFCLSDIGQAKLELEYLDWKKSQSDAKRRELALRDESKNRSMQYLELPDQIQQFKEFFEVNPHYTESLYDAVRKGKSSISVDFSDIAKFSPELALVLLDQPEDALKCAQIAIEKLDIPSNSDERRDRLTVRIVNVSELVSVGHLSKTDLRKLRCIQAQVVVVGERRPQITSSRFECPTCGDIIPIIQNEQKLKEPLKCVCGRKGKFKRLDNQTEDAMSLLVQQPIAELAGRPLRPSTLKVHLQDDLSAPAVRDQLGMNRMVHIVGVLEEVPVMLPTGGISTRSDWRLNANSVMAVEHYDPDIRLNPERIAQIQSEALKPGFKKRLCDSFFPDHIGDDELKELLVSQAVAMPLHLHSEDARKQADREAVHILIMSPPAMGKSRNLAGRIEKLVPIFGRANGTGASRAGLTIGADQKDKDTDLVIPAPQALPNANLGIFIFDEVDKMEIEEQPVLNEALSEHQVSVAKRGVSLTLPSMICFLGLANPRTYEWDLEQDALQQVLNLHYTLLTRCVVYVLKDNPKAEHDKAVALAILRRDEVRERPYDDEFVRDYILYARAKIVPQMRKEHELLLADFYAQLRQMQQSDRKYLGARFVEQARSLILLHAKLYLRTETSEEDLRWANNILTRILLEIGFDPGRLSSTIPRMVSE